MIALSAQPVRKPAAKERQVIGWSSGGAVYADEIAERYGSAPFDWLCRKSRMLRAMSTRSSLSLRNLSGRPQRSPPRLHGDCSQHTGFDEAWQTIEETEHRRGGWPDFEWEDARIDILEARDCSDEAQASRWSCFERALSARHLRECLKRLARSGGS